MKMKYLIYDIYVEQNFSSFLVRNARDVNAVIRQGRTEGDFTLAVSLSVVITFVCAFCLGAFTRPYICRIWRQICRKKSSASENTFSNQGFSAESLTRENTANTQIRVQQKLSFCSGNSSQNVGSHIVDISSLHKEALHNRVLALSTEETNQDQSSINIEVEKEKVSQNNQATNSADEADTEIDDEFFSAVSDHQYGNKAFQRELSNNDNSSHEDLKYLFNENSGKSRFSSIADRYIMDSYSLSAESSDLDLPFARETNFPFSEAQIQTNTQYSKYNDVSNGSNLFQSEIAESLLKRQMTSHSQPLNTQQLMFKRNNCEEELDVNDNINMLNDSENLILPLSYENDTNIDYSNTQQTLKHSPASIQEYDCKEENIRNEDNPVDRFSDSNSIEEGSIFTLSDSSSLTESELEQSNAGDDHLTNPSVTEQMITLSGTGKFTTLLQNPNITTRFQDIMENHENKNETYSETAILSGSGTRRSGTYSSVLHMDSSQIDISDTSHTEKFADHVILSDSDTNNPACCEVLGKTEYVTNPNSPAQNIISNPACKQNINLNCVTLPPLNYSPKSTPDTENISNSTYLKLCEFSTLMQDSDRSIPTDLKENVIEINTAKNHIAQSSSLKNYREPFLQSHSESTDEKTVSNITQKQDSSVQQELHMKMSGSCAQRMQRDFNEGECDTHTEQEVLSGIDKGNSSLCTAELQFHNIRTDSSSSETMQSILNEEKYLQLDHQKEENVGFPANPQSFLNENVKHCSYKGSQNVERNTIGNRANSSEAENETSLDELANVFKAIPILQNSSEKPDKKNEATRGQLLAEGSFFVKKKKAFDGFASVLQSRRTMDSTK